MGLGFKVTKYGKNVLEEKTPSNFAINTDYPTLSIKKILHFPAGSTGSQLHGCRFRPMFWVVRPNSNSTGSTGFGIDEPSDPSGVSFNSDGADSKFVYVDTGVETYVIIFDIDLNGEYKSLEGSGRGFQNLMYSPDMLKVFQTGTFEFTLPSRSIAYGASYTDEFSLTHNLGFTPLCFPLARGFMGDISSSTVTIEGLPERAFMIGQIVGGYGFQDRYAIINIFADETKFYVNIWRIHNDPFASTPYTFPAQNYKVKYTLFGNKLEEMDYSKK